MNTRILVGLLVALIVAGVGVVVFAPQSGDDSATLEVDTGDRQQGTGALGAVLSGDKNLICNYTSSGDGVSNEGTLYYDSFTGRFHTRNVMKDDTGSYQSGVINDNQYVYTWAEGPEGSMAFASKMKVSDLEVNSSAESSAAPGSDVKQLQEDVNYDCVSWVVDESVFVPPTNVEFLTPEEMMEAALQESGVNLQRIQYKASQEQQQQ